MYDPYSNFDEHTLLLLLNRMNQGIEIFVPDTEVGYRELTGRRREFARFQEGREGNLMHDIIRGRDREILKTIYQCRPRDLASCIGHLTPATRNLDLAGVYHTEGHPRAAAAERRPGTLGA